MAKQRKRINPFTQALTTAESQFVDNFPIIYVAGPVSDKVDLNKPAFMAAKDKLQSVGYNVIIPHDIVDPQSTWLNAIIQCLGLFDKINGVAVLDDYENSPGSCIEIIAAERLGIPVAGVDDWVELAEDGA